MPNWDIDSTMALPSRALFRKLAEELPALPPNPGPGTRRRCASVKDAAVLEPMLPAIAEKPFSNPDLVFEISGTDPGRSLDQTASLNCERAPDA